ncbi:MAG: DUF4249 family protein [Bacteroidota bacterium]
MCFIILSILACEKSTDWKLTPNEETKLVVEAILTNENIIQEIRLSQTYPNLNDAPPSIENASISVLANGVNYIFQTDSAGIYKSEIPFTVRPRINYELNIEWEGKNYNATSQLSTVAPIPEITFDTLANANQLTLSDFAPLYNPNQQAMYEVNVDWSHLNSADELTKAKFYLYTFKEVHLSALTSPEKEVITFPKGSRVIIKKYGLNNDFAEYLRARAIETEWKGAVFYSTSENLPSNLSNGALGFYSTCAVLADTLIAN